MENVLDGSDLTVRQRKVLDFIMETIQKRGFPPAVREIGKAVGLSSPSTVHTHLQTLEERGYLKRDPDKPRAIEVRWDREVGAMETRPVIRHLPIYGSIAAGPTTLAEQVHEGVLPFPQEFLKDVPHFALRVKGESIINAGILPGDLAIVRAESGARTGDIVIAQMSGPTGEAEATVKRYKKQGSRIVLIPENDTMAPIEAPRDTVILGKVVGILRMLP